MSTWTTRSSPLEDRITAFVTRHSWPLLVTTLFTTLGLLYFFRWAPVVQHRQSSWLIPEDFLTTYASAVAIIHGHAGNIYGSGFLAFPGYPALLIPVAALSNTFDTIVVEIARNHVPVAGGIVQHIPGTLSLPYESFGVDHGTIIYAVHNEAFLLLGPILLLTASVVFFALDAVAKELGVTWARRGILCVVEGVLVWPIAVIWGHPEDVLAVALALYSLCFAFRGRFVGAGWFYGAALAMQPLVIALFPLLLVLGGRGRAVRLIMRAAIPSAALLVPPLVGNVHSTLHTLTEQPTFPYRSSIHETPWTSFAPYIGGSGVRRSVGGGPIRIMALVLAGAVAWWALRWRERPDLIVWTAAFVLALRIYTEPALSDYYVWPALAVGVLIAARASSIRFSIALVVAVLTTVVAQWEMGWLPWWLCQIVGMTTVLVVASRPEPRPEPEPDRTPKVANRSKPTNKSKAKNKRRTGAGSHR